jgi:hypothetical protein
MTKNPNSKPVLIIETGDPPAGWGVRRTNIEIWDLFVIWCLGFVIFQCSTTPALEQTATSILSINAVSLPLPPFSYLTRNR